MKTRLLLFLLFACLMPAAAAHADDPVFKERRERMVREQIESRGIRDPRVLEAMRKLPRHQFIPEEMRSLAYEDFPVRIGEGQTISQPYIVALMTESLALTGKEKVLEIGTGSGYQAALLGLLVKEAYSIEIREGLARRARRALDEQGLPNVATKRADGYYGWKERAPFDCIMITAAVDHVPPPLLEQLKDGGRMILPLGDPFSYQNLVLITKTGKSYTTAVITGVLFVPMTGAAREK